ncbi:MAG: hypothetical protein ACT4OO_04770 [Nitrospiraceae bacterium]
MRTSFLVLALASLLLILVVGGGGGKHFPSSNPPEYDPNKVYATPPPAPYGPIPELSSGRVDEPQAMVSSGKQSPEDIVSTTDPLSARAATLVSRILAGGADGRVALVEAVTAAGFAILDSRSRRGSTGQA